jgi:hypothetical protein
MEESESDIEIVMNEEMEEPVKEETVKETAKPLVGLPIPKHGTIYLKKIQQSQSRQSAKELI